MKSIIVTNHKVSAGKKKKKNLENEIKSISKDLNTESSRWTEQFRSAVVIG